MYTCIKHIHVIHEHNYREPILKTSQYLEISSLLIRAPMQALSTMTFIAFVARTPHRQSVYENQPD